jgi:1-acyl-sn-glycerol-3-phosphate acyltransferase
MFSDRAEWYTPFLPQITLGLVGSLACNGSTAGVSALVFLALMGIRPTRQIVVFSIFLTTFAGLVIILAGIETLSWFTRHTQLLETARARASGMFLNVVLFLILGINQTKIYIRGGRCLQQTPKCILEANHVGYLDWVIFPLLGFTLKHRDTGVVKIISNTLVEKIPVLSWVMRKLSYPIIQRSWEADQRLLEVGLARINQMESGWVCLFPEGTFTDANCAQEYVGRSQKFCADRSIEFGGTNVLLPRVKGYALIRRTLPSLPVISVTMAYQNQCGQLTNLPLVDPARTWLPTITGGISGDIASVVIDLKRTDPESSSQDRFIYDKYREKNVLLPRITEDPGLVQFKFGSTGVLKMISDLVVLAGCAVGLIYGMTLALSPLLSAGICSILGAYWVFSIVWVDHH